jgi:hypothetical protein
MKRCRWLAVVLLLPLVAAASGEGLIIAAERGDVAALGRLIEAGADVNARDASGRNAVLAATQGGQVDAARLLIARGADVNAQDDIRDSAFLLAGVRGHTEIVRLLIGHRANVNLADRQGATPLTHAEQRGQRTRSDLLRRAGGRR